MTHHAAAAVDPHHPHIPAQGLHPQHQIQMSGAAGGQLFGINMSVARSNPKSM
jgi:hypothetical protein